MKIAALFVASDGPYTNQIDIDAWDECRDARKYNGPYPVIAHPPCQRWGKYYAGSPLVIARTGHRFKKGDDNGCFESALKSVRTYGGVLEHPASSFAFNYYGLPIPDKQEQWTAFDEHGGASIYVEQGNYGHRIRKPTWLYAISTYLPEVDRTVKPLNIPKSAILKVGEKEAYRRGELAYCPKPERIHTPQQFLELLKHIAQGLGPC